MKTRILLYITLALSLFSLIASIGRGAPPLLIQSTPADLCIHDKVKGPIERPDHYNTHPYRRRKDMA